MQHLKIFGAQKLHQKNVTCMGIQQTDSGTMGHLPGLSARSPLPLPANVQPRRLQAMKCEVVGFLPFMWVTQTEHQCPGSNKLSPWMSGESGQDIYLICSAF